MLHTLLTTMLLILPFLTFCHNQPSRGIRTGLWVSLFFFGRIHSLFSILTFVIASCYYFACKRRSFSVTDDFLIRRPMTQFMVFLSAITIFCALGGAVSSYGQTISISPVILQTAGSCGMAATIAGPVFFGFLCDKTGPFPASMVHLFLSVSGVFFTVVSDEFPYCFPFGQILLEGSISGAFLLMPILVLYFAGSSQLSHTVPAVILSLSVLWGLFFHICCRILSRPENALTVLESMLFLLLLAFPFAVISWKKRLVVIQ